MKSGSKLEKVIASGKPAVTAELGPPMSADGHEVVKKANLLKGYCDAANITDCQTAVVRISSIAAAAIALREDIPLLLNHFVELAATSLNKKKPSYPPELLTLLSVYPFPGNVRELQAMVFDAVARHRSGILAMDSFRAIINNDAALQETRQVRGPEFSDFLTRFFGRFPALKEMEDSLIAEALRLADNNQGIAASLLGITRQALNKRLIRQPKGIE